MTLDDIVKMMNAVPNPEEALKLAVAYTHVDEDTKQLLHFATGVMAQSAEIQALEVVVINVDQQFAKYMAKNRGVEVHRLAPLMEMNPNEYPPVLVAEMPPTPSHPGASHLIIDGTHRYVAAAMQHYAEVGARIVPEELWRKYLIEGVPPMSEQQVADMPSGMGAGGGITPEAIERVMSIPSDHEFFQQLDKLAVAIMARVVAADKEDK